MAETYQKCVHCKGTGLCRHCHGTGRLGLEKGKTCSICFPHGSGKCQNCRGLGGFDEHGKPSAPPQQQKDVEAPAEKTD
jgi:hypothetical protein